MAQLPSYVQLLYAGAGESFDPAVIKSEMERGMAKMRRASARVVMELPCTLYFPTRRASLDFDDWYFNVIKRIGMFDFLDPRSRQVRTGRFKDGALGELKPLAGRYARSSRSATLEYLR